MQLPVAMIAQMGSDVTMTVRVVDGMLPEH
jgi:hypothetical protein